MGKADLGAVDGTVARRLDEGEEVMISGIDDDLLEDGLFGREWQCQLGLVLSATDEENRFNLVRMSCARTLSDSIVEAIVAVIVPCVVEEAETRNDGPVWKHKGQASA